MNEKIYFRFAEIDDSDDLLKWRNDEDTRKFSFNSNIISFNEHEEWFKNSLKNPNVNIFIIIDKLNKKIGQVRFDRKKLIAEVSITISSEHRGKGFSSLALQKITQIYFYNFEVNLLIAKVKHDNIKSIRAFKNANFHVHKKTKKYTELRLLNKKGNLFI